MEATKEQEEKRREEAIKKAADELAKSIGKPDLIKRFGDFDLKK